MAKQQTIKRNINQIIIHSAATPNGKWFTADDINQWHKQRRFQRSRYWMAKQNPLRAHIGYHFVILTTGAVETGRHLEEVGAHARGYNKQSVGVCLIGTDKFTPEQWYSLRAHITGLQSHLSSQGNTVEVIAHHQINANKTCPGFSVGDWIREAKKPMSDHIIVPKNNENT